jgi:hypothetical protein
VRPNNGSDSCLLCASDNIRQYDVKQSISCTQYTKKENTAEHIRRYILARHKGIYIINDEDCIVEERDKVAVLGCIKIDVMN